MANQQYNGGRKPQYIEQFRTAIINKSWQFLDETFDQETDKGKKLELVKILMPVLAKTVPQVNINENENKTEISLDDSTKEVLAEILGVFKNKLRDNDNSTTNTTILKGE
jgi:hypothetical protein